MSPVLAHWSASWPVLAGYSVVAGAHIAGLVRLRPWGRSTGARSTAVGREAAVFQGGLLLALLALVSPLGYWSGIYLWVRALQDLALAVVAPGLIVLGAPWTALAQCLRRRPGVTAAGDAPPPPAGTAPPKADTAPPWWLRWPVAVVLAFNVIWIAWHLPVLFDRVLVSSAAAAAEHVMYLGAGILFWLQLIGSRPWSPVARPLRRASLLVGTTAVDTVLGMALVFGSGVLYPAYANASHHVMTVLDDQQLAGAVLWMCMLPPVITAAVAVLLRWLNDEESQALSAGMDRLLTQRNSPWPSRPRFR